MSSYSYSSDDEIDVHFRRGGARYERPAARPHSYYATGPAQSFLVPERTVITTRSRSRDRSRERRVPSPPSTVAPSAPVIINNRIYNEHSSDEEDERRLQLVRPPRRSHSRSRSSSSYLMTRDEFEMERAQRELENMRIAKDLEEKERRQNKELREEEELKRAKKELDEIKLKEARQAEEVRIKRELELERLRQQEKEDEEKERREKEAKDAVERYKKKEMERLQKEKEEREAQEKEYRRRLQEDLLKSGLDEKQIQAVMNKEKVPEAQDDKQLTVARPTYTRMARRHLSLETLRTFRIEYEMDEDPEYVLIKRWVPEWEQDTLWKHTKYVREKRTKLILNVDDRKHHHHHREPEFEWVRKKSDRKRSKSPALLMYLAGARPN